MSDIERIERRLSTVERAVVDGDLELAAVGDAASLTEDLAALIERIDTHEHGSPISRDGSTRSTDSSVPSNQSTRPSNDGLTGPSQPSIGSSTASTNSSASSILAMPT